MKKIFQPLVKLCYSFEKLFYPYKFYFFIIFFTTRIKHLPQVIYSDSTLTIKIFVAYINFSLKIIYIQIMRALLVFAYILNYTRLTKLISALVLKIK